VRKCGVDARRSVARVADTQTWLVYYPSEVKNGEEKTVSSTIEEGKERKKMLLFRVFFTSRAKENPRRSVMDLQKLLFFMSVLLEET